MANQNDGGVRRFGVTDQVMCGRSDLGNGARRSVQRRTPDCLDGINDHHIRRGVRRQRGQDIFDTGCRAEVHCRFRKAHARRTQPKLRQCFFAGNVNGTAAVSGKRGNHLQQQRRLADTRVAAK
jgi:hypothetical protein